MQSMPTQEVEQALLVVDTLSGGGGRDERLAAVAAELRPLYMAMPKNGEGKLDPTVVRYALHRYFARKHGWHLRGLEPRGDAWNASSPATIMKDRAPAYIMERLEHRLHGHGLGLEELAVFAVALGDLIRKEAVADLEDLYVTAGISKAAQLTESALASLLKMYLMTYIKGEHTTHRTSADFAELEAQMVEDIIVWFDAKMWLKDLQGSLEYTQRSRRNPFVAGLRYEFEHATEAVHELGHHFGTFQNLECKALKEKLVDMEHGGSGRVTLSKFYSGIDDRDWPFIESASYLRNLGALDDSDPTRLSVIIPNFLSSPPNCVAPSSFYSVCCMDECEGLLSQVEQAVASPAATVERLVQVVSELPSDTVAAPRNLSSVQVSRLHDIAAHHQGGRVPLHGRLFAQWMHHAYPRECRYPHVAGSTAPLNQKEFAKAFGGSAEVSDEEIAEYLENATLGEFAPVALPGADRPAPGEWCRRRRVDARHVECLPCGGARCCDRVRRPTCLAGQEAGSWLCPREAGTLSGVSGRWKPLQLAECGEHAV